jgi:hypothetical protein
VPGDIVLLEAGRTIPADLRLIESFNLQIEESALTGESVPSDKNAKVLFDAPKISIGDQVNMAFMSTLVTYGRGEGVVVATAMDTEIGRIAKILDEEHEEMTPLQKRLEELGKSAWLCCHRHLHADFPAGLLAKTRYVRDVPDFDQSGGCGDSRGVGRHRGDRAGARRHPDVA